MRRAGGGVINADGSKKQQQQKSSLVSPCICNISRMKGTISEMYRSDPELLMYLKVTTHVQRGYVSHLTSDRYMNPAHHIHTQTCVM